MPNELSEELKDFVREHMFQYNYNPNGSDWWCGFCHNRPSSTDDSIFHNGSCFGVKMQMFFDDPQFEEHQILGRIHEG